MAQWEYENIFHEESPCWQEVLSGNNEKWPIQKPQFSLLRKNVVYYYFH